MERLKLCFTKITDNFKNYSIINQKKNVDKENAVVEIDAEAVKSTNLIKLPKLTDYPSEEAIEQWKKLLLFFILILELFIFMLIIGSFIIPTVYQFPVDEYIEPCNSTNITLSLQEVRSMKIKFEEINFAKNSIKFVADFNISTFTNIFLAEKLDNYTYIFNAYKTEYNEQKDLYYGCYKQNLIKEFNRTQMYVYNLKMLIDIVIFAAFLVYYELICFKTDKIKEFKKKGNDNTDEVDKLRTDIEQFEVQSLDDLEELKAEITLENAKQKIEAIEKKFKADKERIEEKQKKIKQNLNMELERLTECNKILEKLTTVWSAVRTIIGIHGLCACFTTVTFLIMRNVLPCVITVDQIDNFNATFY